VQNDHIEQWVDVPDTNGLYQVSTFGRIKSIPVAGTIGRQRGRILSLKPNMSRKGYCQICLCVIGRKPKIVQVHRVVALTFLGPCPDGLQVNHKDGNKENNRPGNLEYVTCRENIRHCWDNGLHGTEHCRGVNNNKAKLTEDDVRQIRSLTGSLSCIALQFSVSKTTISGIKRRMLWKHIE